MRVLLVSKMEDMRWLQSEIIRRHYAEAQILEANSAEEAFALLEKERVDLLVTGSRFESIRDMPPVPKLRGTALARIARKLQPHIFCVLATADYFIKDEELSPFHFDIRTNHSEFESQFKDVLGVVRSGLSR